MLQYPNLSNTSSLPPSGKTIDRFIYVILLVYLDQEDDCERISIRNDDLAEGDLYLIKSDRYQGGSPEKRRPAECSLDLNFGDRYISVRLVEHWCEANYQGPFLIVYDSCNGQRSGKLVDFVHFILIYNVVWYNLKME